MHSVSNPVCAISSASSFVVLQSLTTNSWKPPSLRSVHEHMRPVSSLIAIISTDAPRRAVLHTKRDYPKLHDLVRIYFTHLEMNSPLPKAIPIFWTTVSQTTVTLARVWSLGPNTGSFKAGMPPSLKRWYCVYYDCYGLLMTVLCTSSFPHYFSYFSLFCACLHSHSGLPMPHMDYHCCPLQVLLPRLVSPCILMYRRFCSFPSLPSQLTRSASALRVIAD